MNWARVTSAEGRGVQMMLLLAALAILRDSYAHSLWQVNEPITNMVEQGRCLGKRGGARWCWVGPVYGLVKNDIVELTDKLPTCL